MSEIERLLTATVTALEQELRQTQEVQAKTLAGQDQTLSAHAQALRQIRQQIASLSAQQRESTQHLQHLSELSARLEPLLTRLSGMLGGKQAG